MDLDFDFKSRWWDLDFEASDLIKNPSPPIVMSQLDVRPQKVRDVRQLWLDDYACTLEFEMRTRTMLEEAFVDSVLC